MNNDKSANASAFATLSLSDLTAVCGGEATSPSTTTQSTTVTPNLTCPAGTSPHWESTSGGGSAQGSGGLFSGSAGGGGSTQKFWCDPIPQQPRQ
jgi:hypothetical protein